MQIDELLTKEEQKILFFFLLLGFLGAFLHLHFSNEKSNPIELTASENLSSIQIKYDINTISFEQLQTIRGIGAVRASAIVDYRDENKPISLDELINVRGIGPKTLENIRGYFYVDNN